MMAYLAAGYPVYYSATFALILRDLYSIFALLSGRIARSHNSKQSPEQVLITTRPMINEKKTGWKQYREGLSFNGELCVNPDSWGIHYYFPGVDLRYKGVIKVVSGDDVRTYVEEWKTALAKAKDLVKTVLRMRIA